MNMLESIWLNPQIPAAVLLGLLAVGAVAVVGRRRGWSLANGLTWVSAIGTVIMAGTAIYQVAYNVTSSTTLAALAVCLLEVPMVAFALRAKEAQGGGGNWKPMLRKTWLLAGASAVVSAVAAVPDGPAAVLLRTITPLIGAMLWHDALAVAHAQAGGQQAQGRWKWTPERILTHLGLYTAKSLDVEDAEIHRRLTKVADRVIAFERARSTATWEDRASRKLDQVFRAAERDLNLSGRPERMDRLTAMIQARTAAYALAEHARIAPAPNAVSTDTSASPERQPVEPVSVAPNARPNGGQDGARAEAIARANALAPSADQVSAAWAKFGPIDGRPAWWRAFKLYMGADVDQMDAWFGDVAPDAPVPDGMAGRMFELLTDPERAAVVATGPASNSKSNGSGERPNGSTPNTPNTRPGSGPNGQANSAPNSAPNGGMNDRTNRQTIMFDKDTAKGLILREWESGNTLSVRALAAMIGRSVSTTAGYVAELKADGHGPIPDPYTEPGSEPGPATGSADDTGRMLPVG